MLQSQYILLHLVFCDRVIIAYTQDPYIVTEVLRYVTLENRIVTA